MEALNLRLAHLDPRIFENTPALVDRVLKEPFAAVYSDRLLKRLVNAHSKELYLGKERFIGGPYGFPIRKTFPYQDEINEKYVV